MAHYSPEEAFDTLKERVSGAIKGHFPIEGKKNVLSANKVWVDDTLHLDDIRGQKNAKIKGRTWAVPIRAELELRDKKTGKILDRKAVTVGQLPKVTRRYSYIVNGNEYQVNNQFRLKSGVYTRVTGRGDVASQWNLAKGLGFEMNFDPKSKKMSMKYPKGSNVPLYPILKAVGVSDDDIERQWGKEVLTANKTDKEDVALRKFYRTFNGENPENLDAAKKFVATELGATQLRPDSTKVTLGKAFDTVSGGALLAGSKKILAVSKKEADPDDRDSLEFKDMWSAEDLLDERIRKKAAWDIKRKYGNTVDKYTKVKSIANPDIIGKPIRGFFTNSTLAERPDQMNPVSFVSGNRRTTIMGEGGVTSPHQVTLEAKSINPSHMGFLDPIQTPESDKIGTTLQLSFGVKKDGKDLKVRAYNTKTKKTEWITPSKARHSNVAFPDQYRWDGKTPKPVSTVVKTSDKEGTISSISPKDVDYILKSSKGMFDMSANMIPFLQNDQGNRTMVAAKQLEQAISLKEREAPLVQVKGEGAKTFEQVLGGFTAHHSGVDGTVERVGKDHMVIRGTDDKRHEVQLYDDFPLNDPKSMLNSTPSVKKGDSVKKGQIIADTNFTRDGVLALGKNLNVAYMPYKGYNFEDGIVISETAAKKLTSEHMFRDSVAAEKNVILNKKKFLAETVGTTTKAQADKLDDDGVIQEGQRVEPGDVLIAVMKKEEASPEAQKLGLFSKKLLRPVKARPITWTKEVPGVVNKVVRHGKNTTVFVKAEAAADIGDKIVGRHGNKGIITSILPDHEMPHSEDGTPTEVLLNPTGVPTRINLGQVLETAASKIALKTGKPYVVNNFDPKKKDYTRELRKELKSHDLSDTEDLIDPTTGQRLKKVLTGKQYILKLHHTAEKGLQARSRDSYDSNMTPSQGGPRGGQTMDAMGMYAMLAHNARENIREMQTYKSDMNDEFWSALQAGDPIPPPKVPFAHKKFEGYLKGMGVDVRKDGNSLVLSPLTDKKVLEMSNGELKDPARAVRGKDARPEAGGIFDPTITGTRWPLGRLGDKWSHITLAERMPNPLFEKPVISLLGMKAEEYNGVIKGETQLNGKTGPAAIANALRKIDVEKEKKVLEGKIEKLRGTNLNKANKKLKYLRALERAKLSPTEAYTTRHLPIMPPVMRPLTVLDNGDLRMDDVNNIYRHVGAANDQLRNFDPMLPEDEKKDLRVELYDGLKGLALTGITSQGRHFSGIGETLAGKNQPKEGFFQNRIIGRRQDLSMRSTIVPEPSLSLDEVGIPRKAAAELYKPFVVRRLRRFGYTPLEAIDQVKKNTATARQALETEVENRPLLLKRDPVLHKHGVQAFKPRLIEGKAIKIHPLATSGFNADFDGDKMSAFVPVSEEAVREAMKMMPSHNLFSPSTAQLLFKPGQESMMGLFKLTEMGKDTGKRVSTAAAAAKMVRAGDIDINDIIRIGDLEGDLKVKLAAVPIKTTVGRVLVYKALPKEMQDKRILTDPNFVLDKKTLHNVLSEVGSKHQGDFARVADRMKDLGNTFSTGLSIGLEDFESDNRVRDSFLTAARRKESQIRATKTGQKKTDAIVDLYVTTGKAIDKRTKARADVSGNRMYDWVRSGARGSWDQFKQMTVAPMLVADSKGKPVPIPIDKSYSEGLDIGSYWAAMHGARMGTIGRVLGTETPGMLSKQMINASMNQIVMSKDCGTNRGVPLKADDRDVLDRYTARDIKLGVRGGKDKGSIPAGTLITPEVVNRLKNNKVDDVEVRSPLKCSHGRGICSTCYGLTEKGKLPEKGANLGVIAAHALGEPATQLAMNSFHTGGVVGARGTTATNKFSRLQQLLQIPKTLPGAATLSEAEGNVEKVEKDPVGGWNVFVKGKRHYVPGRRELTVQKGVSVKKGDSLSSGDKNPRQMLDLVGMPAVQSYLTSELYRAYEDQAPVRRRNVETFVRSMTNTAKVTDAGDHGEYLPGDVAPLSELEAFNKALPKTKKKIQYDHKLTDVAMVPKEVMTDWMARMNSRNLKQTLIDASAERWRSNLHSTHPIPGMAYGAEFGKGTLEEPWVY